MSREKLDELFVMKLTSRQYKKLEELADQIGASRAEVVRRLLDDARAMPAVVQSAELERVA